MRIDIAKTAKKFAIIDLADLKSQYDIKVKVAPVYSRKTKSVDSYLCSATVSQGNKTFKEKIKHLFRKMPRVEIRNKVLSDDIDTIEKSLTNTAKNAVKVFSGEKVKIN